MKKIYVVWEHGYDSVSTVFAAFSTREQAEKALPLYRNADTIDEVELDPALVPVKKAVDCFFMPRNDFELTEQTIHEHEVFNGESMGVHRDDKFYGSISIIADTVEDARAIFDGLKKDRQLQWCIQASPQDGGMKLWPGCKTLVKEQANTAQWWPEQNVKNTVVAWGDTQEKAQQLAYEFGKQAGLWK
jgi:hypothetical protein